MKQNKYVSIVGTGSYLPKNVVLNHQLEKDFEGTDAWIFAKTGISQRFIAGKDDSVLSMAQNASIKALNDANVDSVDCIIVATTTADRCFPSTACLLQSQLNIGKGYPAFDISAACSGFSYALKMAENMLLAKGDGSALVVGSEVMSRILNWEDRRTCVLFGDGAAAVVLSVTSQPGILCSRIGADGKHQELIDTTPLWQKNDPVIRMNGPELFRYAVNILSQECESMLHQCGKTVEDIDWFIPHQSNVRIIELVAKKLSLPMEKVIVTIDQHANTSSASVPIALDVGMKEGKIQDGDCIMLATFGAGLTWGVSLMYI